MKDMSGYLIRHDINSFYPTDVKEILHSPRIPTLVQTLETDRTEYTKEPDDSSAKRDKLKKIHTILDGLDKGNIKHLVK
jgi:hypothetical protein